MEQVIGSGKNIKCYDRIKLTHILSGYRLHSNNFDCKGGSYNQAVSCHKIRDETDWFVILRPSESNITYHFRYGDHIILNNIQQKKHLHLSSEYESQVSKNLQISLTDASSDGNHDPFDQWIVELAENGQDEYWRVGEVIKIRNRKSGAYLSSHRRKIRENDDFEVYGKVISEEKVSLGQLDKKVKEQTQFQEKKGKVADERYWMVSEMIPFLYTAPITQQKKIKMTEEAQELSKLNRTKYSLPPVQAARNNPTEQILKMENSRLQQIENERKKVQQNERRVHCWKKFCCCCCCCCLEDQEYVKLK